MLGPDSKGGVEDWVSADGLSWRRVALSSKTFAGLSNAIFALTAGGPGLVANGDVGKCDSPTAPCAPAVWLSADGVTWHRAASADFHGKFLLRIFSFGRVLVAWEDDHDAAGVDSVWLSTVGEHWTRDSF